MTAMDGSSGRARASAFEFFSGLGPFLSDCSDETHTPAGYGADTPPFLSRIFDCATGSIDSGAAG
jgi:hypothetical protein